VEARPSIPLFPLPNVVHFPRTDLRLHVFEPRYRRMVRDVVACEERLRWIGMVLLKPKAEQGFGEPPEIFPEGTAGRLVDVDYLSDGRSNIVLHGEFRFVVEREEDDLLLPYRRAVVRPLEELQVDEKDPGILTMRRELLVICRGLCREMGENFPVRGEDLEGLEAQRSFEAVVNGLAAGIDLPALRKIGLLESPLPDRAVELLRILRSRRRLLDLLRPYRHLAAGAESN
jgi:Lon protease-like protein